MPSNGGVLVVVAGASGSGKSTVVAQVAPEYGLAVVCPDAIRAELFGDEADQSDGWRVFRLAYERMRGWLSDPNCPGVIFDAKNCRRKARREILKNADGLYRTAVCAVSSADLETCLMRNASRQRRVPDEVIARDHARLWDIWPGVDEGFDWVLDLDELEAALPELL